MEQALIAKLNFAKMHGIEIEERVVDGYKQEVMVIPMKINGIYRSRMKGNKGLFLNAFITPLRCTALKNTHYIYVSLQGKAKERMENLGYKPGYYMGYACLRGSFKPRKNKKAQGDNISEILYGEF